MHHALARATCLALAAIVVSGCATSRDDRNLIVTEVGRKQVELYLDEPAGRVLKLGDGIELSVHTATGRSVSVDFGVFEDTLDAGSFLIVWEGDGYNGPPVKEPFPGGQQGAVPGIKVDRRFFDDLDAAPSEVRLHGSHSRAVGVVVVIPRVIEDRVDDVVRFGQPPEDRPETGGAFEADGSLQYPTGSWSHQRLWVNGAPRDTDDESDWQTSTTSWGVPTP